jgi:hypothetical protein
VKPKINGKQISGMFANNRIVITDPAFGKDEVALMVDSPKFKMPNVDFEIPDEFAPLLVDETTRERAAALCLKIHEQKFCVSEPLKEILTLAEKKGLAAGEERLDKYIADRPALGKVQFYRSNHYGSYYDGCVDVTDGLDAYAISAPIKKGKNLPPNIYIHSASLSIDLTPNQLKKATQDMEGLFSLLETLAKLCSYVANSTIVNLKDAYFKNHKKYGKLLEKFGKIADWRRYCTDIVTTLKEKKVYCVKKSFLVNVDQHESSHDEKGLYLVSPNGRLRALNMEVKDAKSREQLGRMCKNGIPPSKLVKCTVGPETAHEIASALKDVAPQLALIIMQ